MKTSLLVHKVKGPNVFLPTPIPIRIRLDCQPFNHVHNFPEQGCIHIDVEAVFLPASRDTGSEEAGQFKKPASAKELCRICRVSFQQDHVSSLEPIMSAALSTASR